MTTAEGPLTHTERIYELARQMYDQMRAETVQEGGSLGLPWEQLPQPRRDDYLDAAQAELEREQ